MASWTRNETPTRVSRTCDKSEAQGTVSVGTRSGLDGVIYLHIVGLFV